ncbi:MAG: hypothetical protein K0M67_20720, partial [Thiobacillus sp.]|nr:hypothetical protein [Thiobacillus sp.]
GVWGGGGGGGFAGGVLCIFQIGAGPPRGEVFGGHVAPGCRVRTTAEVLLALLPEWAFTREPDVATSYAELVVKTLEG